MKTNRKRYMHLWITLTLALLMLAAVPLQAQQTAPAEQPRTTMPAQPPGGTTPVQARDNDTTRGELANMDRFLDSHPEIAEQLRRDPSLINNKQFVDNHPQLQEFLQDHPALREEFKENPNAFMRQEDRYDRRDDHDTTRAELASMDRFMDAHPEIAEQLRKDPSLVDNKQFVDNHPALQEYLQNHPQVREEFKENPNAFMRQEDRYDQHEDRYGRSQDSANYRDRGEMSNFGDFLRGHTNVADQLSKDPSLANNKEFLSTHPELQSYLSSHPEMQQQLAANPQAVMTSPGLAATTPGKTYTQELKPKERQ